jgi:poly(3-hydroxybutyrate) depolymerase
MKHALVIMALVLQASAGFNPGNFSKQTYTNSAYSIGSMPYQLFRPSNYTTTIKYPLVLFLHGAGQAGTNGDYGTLVYGAPTLFADDTNQAKHPCVIVAPQCPGGSWMWVNWGWGEQNCACRISVTGSPPGVAIFEPLKMAMDIVDTIIKKNSIDTTRIYVTGLSMGGWGTWDAITRFPNKFAAGVPICGGGDSSKAYRIVQGRVGVWAFHSQDDGTVPFSNSVCMIDAMTRAGGAPRHTWYSNLGHNSWDAAYSTPGLTDWVFSFSKVQTAAGPMTPRARSRDPNSFSLSSSGTTLGVTVAAGKATAALLDMSGRLLAERSVRAGVRADVRVPAPGMYVVAVCGNGATTVRKVAAGR